MKLITYLVTILIVVGSYTALQGIHCTDGQATCNDGFRVLWPCKVVNDPNKFPPYSCVKRDPDMTAETLCKDHQGVKTSEQGCELTS